MHQVELSLFVQTLLQSDRYKDPRRLTKHGWKAYSQNDEDGIIQEIFCRIGTTSRNFVEFGVEAGIQCNSMWLLLQGWTGLWIEANAESCARIRKSHQAWIQSGSLALVEQFITRDNINALISSRFQGEIDLLSVDLDSNDYWIWQAIDAVQPRVVVVEYNASWPPPAALSVPYDDGAGWDGTNLFGASLSALNGLGHEKGYSLVGCSLSGVNAFFVRNDLVGDRFFAPGSEAEHYEPARYFLCEMTAGHPPGIGPVVQIA